MLPETEQALPRLVPKPGEHAVFLGQNGSGKTTLMIRLLGAYYGKRQIEILDTKHDPAFGRLAGRIVRRLRDAPRMRWPKEPLVIYRPDRREGHDPQVLDAWCEWIYARGATVAVIDEVTQVARSPLSYGPGLLDLLTRSRVRGVSAWVGTQRPVQAPRIIFSEPIHVFCFYLADQRDRDIVAAFTDPALREPPPDRHGFWYANRATREVAYFPG
jgi:energy-coupling factor transporter ATP-binding protein EcfA2